MKRPRKSKPKSEWMDGEEAIAEIRKLLRCSRKEAIEIIQQAVDRGLLPLRRAPRAV